MPLLLWQDEYRDGDPSVVRQRVLILNLINELNDCLADDREKAALNNAFRTLATYIGEDLTRQEASLSGPDGEAHRAAHAEFAREVARLRELFVAGEGRALSSRLLMLLAAWWQRHVLGADAALAAREGGRLAA